MKLAKNAMKEGSFDLAIHILNNLVRQNYDYAESESYIGLGVLEKRCDMEFYNGCEWFWNKYG